VAKECLFVFFNIKEKWTQNKLNGLIFD